MIWEDVLAVFFVALVGCGVLEVLEVALRIRREGENRAASILRVVMATGVDPGEYVANSFDRSRLGRVVVFSATRDGKEIATLTTIARIPTREEILRRGRRDEKV